MDAEPTPADPSQARQTILNDELAHLNRLVPRSTAFFVTGMGATVVFLAKMRLAGMIIPTLFDWAPCATGLMAGVLLFIVGYRYGKTIKECAPNHETRSWPMLIPGTVAWAFIAIPILMRSRHDGRASFVNASAVELPRLLPNLWAILPKLGHYEGMRTLIVIPSKWRNPDDGEPVARSQPSR